MHLSIGYITGKLAILSGIKPLSKNWLNLNTEEYHLDIIRLKLKRSNHMVDVTDTHTHAHTTDYCNPLAHAR